MVDGYGQEFGQTFDARLEGECLIAAVLIAQRRRQRLAQHDRLVGQQDFDDGRCCQVQFAPVAFLFGDESENGASHQRLLKNINISVKKSQLVLLERTIVERTVNGPFFDFLDAQQHGAEVVQLNARLPAAPFRLPFQRLRQVHVRNHLPKKKSWSVA